MAKLPKFISILFDKIFDRNVKGVKVVKWNKVKLGYPVLFYYDAKWKATLPYWDSTPFSIVIAKYNDGFLGINLHYVEWTKRLQLAKIIMEKAKYKTKFSYLDIKKAWNSAKLPEALLYLCIRRYLGSHIRSEIKMFGVDTYYEIVKNVRPAFIKQSETAVLAAIRLKYKIQQNRLKNRKK